MKLYTTSVAAVVGLEVRERGCQERGEEEGRESVRQVVAIIAVEMFGIVAAKFMQKCRATIKIQSVSNSCQFNVSCIHGVCAICKAGDSAAVATATQQQFGLIILCTTRQPHVATCNECGSAKLHNEKCRDMCRQCAVVIGQHLIHLAPAGGTT